ncbi:hypothetical protein SCOCK_270004 [Actinacidiphila cocklensis]|uniref:Uncharacterized protein n=1 Tax=Actinacidiphila cocklensis TaxID=887465 RepID=A0A9W4DQI1_9ACTN|nr:hypothetical protein SCOCK_270004 [Actinacidiphila cocklensis]
MQAVASPLGHSTNTAGEDDPPRRADDEIRTRDPHLGKVMLYQLSHVRTPPESNSRGDGLNSSGFPGQLKNRFPQRAGPMTSS